MTRDFRREMGAVVKCWVRMAEKAAFNEQQLVFKTDPGDTRNHTFVQSLLIVNRSGLCDLEMRKE